MKKLPNFSDIENHRHLVEENEFFLQYSNEELSDHYDANCMLLKFSPTLPEFKVIEQIQWDTQTALNQNHMKFLWPEDTGLMPKVLTYLDQKSYQVGMQNLYFVTPDLFKKGTRNKALKIVKVLEEHYQDFLSINLEEDALHGSDFVAHKKKMYPFQYKLAHTTFLLAYFEDEPVGSMIVVDSDHFVEVDNVLTVSSFRKNKVASTLLNYVIHEHTSPNQSIILVADAEDTAKEVYEKLGFQYVSNQISVEKEICFA